MKTKNMKCKNCINGRVAGQQCVVCGGRGVIVRSDGHENYSETKTEKNFGDLFNDLRR